jgi:prophage antirepressor-like protein
MNITPFYFEGAPVEIRTDENGEIWFAANEVCAILEYGNPYQAIKSHVEDEDLQKLEVPTPGGIQQVNHVNESGLYALIFGSTKPKAKTFKRWVTSEVLPSIRKTGRYEAKGGEAPDAALQILDRLITLVGHLQKPQPPAPEPAAKPQRRRFSPPGWKPGMKGDRELAMQRLIAAIAADGRRAVAKKLGCSYCLITRILSQNDPREMSGRLAWHILNVYGQKG